MKTTRNNRTKSFIGLIAVLLLALFTACNENNDYALPADGDIAYVNFVNAGEIFIYGLSDTLYRQNRLYINDSINNPPFDNYNGKTFQPLTFNYESGRDLIRQYPTMVSGGGYVPSNENADVFWMPIHTGDYRFIFTSRDKTFLKTANATLNRQSYHKYYLVESAETDSSYVVVDAPIERNTRQEGKVTIQLVNLSPDFGPLEVIRSDDAGNKLASSLPAALGFGQTAYAEFTTADAASTKNNILFYFSHPGKGEKLATSVVPATSGAVYTVVFKGFAQATTRKIKKNNITQVAVEVQPNLRAYVERVFY